MSPPSILRRRTPADPTASSGVRATDWHPLPAPLAARAQGPQVGARGVQHAGSQPGGHLRLQLGLQLRELRRDALPLLRQGGSVQRRASAAAAACLSHQTMLAHAPSRVT